MRSYIVKENHISSAVSEIIGTDRLIEVRYLYIRIKNPVLQRENELNITSEADLEGNFLVVKLEIEIIRFILHHKCWVLQPECR